ncbi:MAG: hypothetical protein ACE5JX_17375 [Acidobacteriota bacterium]
MSPQGGTIGWDQGLTVLNPNDKEIQIRIEAFLPDQTRTAERELTLNPGEKVAAILNEQKLFVPDFSQAGGYINLSCSPQGCLAFSLFFPTPEFRTLAAIPGQ